MKILYYNWVDYLDAELLSREGSPVSRAQAEQWTYEAGLPDDAPVPSSANLENAQRLAASWVAGETALVDIDISAWSPHAKIHFINSLPEQLSQAMLAELDATWQLSDTSNAEIARTWFIQVAMRRYTDVYAQLEAHLNRYGRGRLIAPVYRALLENGEDAQLAREMFERARHAYHPITAGWIETSLNRG